MVWLPTASADVVKVARAEAFNVTVANVVVPSRNCTVPVATPPLVVTTAVNVTDCPVRDGFADEVSVVVLDARLTVWLRTADVLGSQFPPPA